MDKNRLLLDNIHEGVGVQAINAHILHLKASDYFNEFFKGKGIHFIEIKIGKY